MKNRSDFHDCQNNALGFAKKKKKCALFLGMGIGKTVVSLTAASDFLDDFRVIRVLIIAPLRVANTVWKQEAKKWQHLKDLRISICTGDEKERIAAVNSNAEIHVINRENVQWLINNCKWRWDMVIIDESSSFKSHSSQRFKYLKKVTKYLRSVLLLSGTPSPNGQMDLWSQMFLIDNGERLGRNITQYRNRFFTLDHTGFKYDLKEGAADEINKLISDVCVTMETDDYIKLPPNMPPIVISIDLPKKALAQYKEIEKEFLLQLESVDIEAPSAAALGNKLLQICNGAIYDAEKNIHEIHDEKIQALREIIEDNPNENLLIAYNYKSDLKRILEAFPYARVLSDNVKDQEEWNAGKIKMLVTHPASAGHGLNLQFGGNVIVWFGLTWSLELYQQFNARLRRQGQLKPVRIFHLVAKGCIDERLVAAVESKAKTQKELVDFLKYKEILHNVK